MNYASNTEVLLEKIDRFQREVMSLEWQIIMLKREKQTIADQNENLADEIIDLRERLHRYEDEEAAEMEKKYRPQYEDCEFDQPIPF